MNFKGTWRTQNGEVFKIEQMERPGGMYIEGDEIYTTPERADLKWDRDGNAFREVPSTYKYYETQWNRAPEFDLMERISEKDSRR